MNSHADMSPIEKEQVVSEEKPEIGFSCPCHMLMFLVCWIVGVCVAGTVFWVVPSDQMTWLPKVTGPKSTYSEDLEIRSTSLAHLIPLMRDLQVGDKIELEMVDGSPTNQNVFITLETEQADRVFEMTFDRNWLGVNTLENGVQGISMQSEQPTGVRPYLPSNQVNKITLSCLKSGYGLIINGVDAFMSVPWVNLGLIDKPETK